MICFVFRARRRVKGKVRVARTWNGKLQLQGDPKPTVVALKVTDKQVAQEKLRRIVCEIERERAGFGPSKAERESSKQPVGKCVREYIQTKRGQHCDERYVHELELKLLRLARECGWTMLRDITANSFEAWRGHQSNDKMLPKTLNEYHAAAFGFCKWLERRTGDNPMRMVARIKALGDPRRKRRAFAPEELWRLINASGERGVLYLVAAFTGLRRGELEQIEWRDVYIDGAKPYINVRSSISKNSKTVPQPLPLNVAAALRRWRGQDVEPTALVSND